MSRRYINLIIILVLLAAAIWVDLPNNSGINIGSFQRSLETILGLDLQGGMQVLLEVDLPESTPVDAQSMQDARQILENRSNGLGVSEVIFQVAGERRIVGEFPGLTNTDEVIAVLKETGQLEFVDLGSTYLPEGTVIKTDYGNSSDDGSATATPEATATLEATAEATLAAAAEGEAQPTVEATATTPEETIWHTIMTGDQLSAVAVTTDQLGNYVVQFELKPDGKETFADYTTNNVGKYLAIVLDKQVVSAPTIDTPITEGSGIIRGNFTYDSANALAIQLRYGSLPIPLKVVESRVIGPTLGQDSLNKSLLAGIIGFALVTLFMIIYYRLPGVVAILAIINYALVTLALFKLIPVTLTLPGIAGFLLSTGGALDANILMFERLKEELHQGRNLKQAVELSWKRAWPSIRDSNIATIITSIILFWFGSQYGATIVKGFALTLALGVGVSLFNAVMVTRTLLTLTLDFVDPVKHLKWFGA
ncbi:MAG: protein translocase subunit SecD [Anaerolineaceae bacterium]|nr:protein translocase subunit SecD [Anaerolineaceae bacterium]